MDDFDDSEIDSLSLAEFCQQAKLLLDSDDTASFTRFVLCGQHEGRQVVVDAIRNRIQDHHLLKGLRDYDSLLGIDKDIRVRTSLSLYPVARKEDTLRNNIHLDYSFNFEGHHDTVPIHKIPNLCIGKWALQNMIRVLFPALCEEGRSSSLSQEEQKTFYEKGFRPAVVSLLGASAADWPPNYESEMFRARGHSGHLSFITKSLPEWHVALLGDKIRENLRFHDITWAEGLVFLHQIRGVKNTNQHTPYADPSEVALEEWLDRNFLKGEDLLLGDWWIDVGLQISSDRKDCLAWRTDSHCHVVEEVLDIPNQHAERITSIDSSKYSRDLTSHLTAVSGCRITPGTRAEGPFSTKYLQLYTTDKSLTYRPDNGHYGKYITCQDVMAGKADSYCEKLYNVYQSAIEDNFSLARVEVRVPIKHATEVLLSLTNRTICKWLVSFSRVEWWSLRAYRVLAFKYVLDWQKNGPISHRTTNEAILLTAAGPWLLNGLHSTPDDRSASRELMVGILPHVERDGADPNTLAFPARTSHEEEEDESESTDSDSSVVPRHRFKATANTLPYNPYGLVFLRAIRVGAKYPVPRFQHSSLFQYIVFSTKAFRFFFGKNNIDELKEDLIRKTIVQRHNPSRISNKRRTAPRQIEEGERALFKLSRKGFKLPAPVVDEGSDIDVDSGNEPDGGDSREDIDSKLSKIWRQFLVDLAAKAPNRKGATFDSYCRLDADQRSMIDDKVHQNSKLSDYWVDCQWKFSTKSEWDVSFNRLWPQKGTILYGNAQNYPTTTYYVQWVTLTNDSDLPTVNAMRSALKKKFDTLYWMPHAQTDRIWHTKYLKGFRRFDAYEEFQAAPRILINPKVDTSTGGPTW